MDNSGNMSFADVIDKLLHYKKRIILITVAFTLLGGIYVFSLPRAYTAKTGIVIEKKQGQVSGTLGLINSLGIGNTQSSDGITIELAPVIIKSIPFLLEFYEVGVERFGQEEEVIPLSVYLSSYQKSPWWRFGKKKIPDFPAVPDSVISKYELAAHQSRFIKAAKDIFVVQTDKKTNVMTLSATTQDPMVSVILADSLAHKLQEYLTLYQTSKAQQELEQWTNITEMARERYYKCQEAYADYVDRNMNLKQMGAKARTERLQNDMNIALQTYREVASQVELARTKLLENTPVYTVLDPPMLDKSASFPNRKLTVLVSFLVGLFLGIGSVIIGDIWRSIISEFKK